MGDVPEIIDQTQRNASPFYRQRLRKINRASHGRKACSNTNENPRDHKHGKPLRCRTKHNTHNRNERGKQHTRLPTNPIRDFGKRDTYHQVTDPGGCCRQSGSRGVKLEEVIVGREDVEAVHQATVVAHGSTRDGGAEHDYGYEEAGGFGDDALFPEDGEDHAGWPLPDACIDLKGALEATLCFEVNNDLKSIPICGDTITYV